MQRYVFPMTLALATAAMVLPASAFGSPLHVHTSDTIADRLLVEVTPGFLDAAQSKARDLGATVRVVLPQINFVSMEAAPGRGEDLYAAFAALPYVVHMDHDAAVHATFIPNDPSFAGQWGPPAIAAPSAWDFAVGGPHTIAVVDTGVQYTHPDLAGNFCFNGQDFVALDGDSMDEHGHGTHVAGIAAGVTNNGIGIAGLAQNCIMAVRVLDAGGSGSIEGVTQGVLYAALNGADIINLSLGGLAGAPVCAAVDTAFALGILVVAAAGNSGLLGTLWPANCAGAMAVASLDPPAGNTVSGFSSVGPKVEIAAPGAGVLSTFLGSTYTTLSGTSMAAPHVAGVAALVWSVRPDYTNVQVRCLLDATATDIVLPGPDPFSGFGRVDAVFAVTAASNTSTCIPPVNE